MKINFKSVAATVMAVAMSLSLSIPAFAAPVANGKLTVTGNELAGKNVFAVRMFSAVANESEGSYTFSDYELEGKWQPFFENIDYNDYNSDSKNDTDIASPVDAKEALAYMEWLANKEETDWATFAEKAQDWLYEQDPDFYTVSEGTATIANDWETIASVAKATEVEPVEVNEAPSGSATFASLTSGYYVVFPEGGSTGVENRGTDAMLINIPTDRAGATWNIKSTFPTVDKKVDTNETVDDTHEDATANGSAQVGDVVTFILTSAVPDMSDYTTFYFAFNDTLSDGLKVVDNTGADVVDGDNLTIDGLTVTIDGETVTGYTVSLHSNVLKVEFTNLKSVTQAAEADDIGKAIVVTYKAMITEGAVATPALNTVEVEYSNNPNTTDHGTSTPDESDVFTYEIDVNKWSTEAGGITGNLADAEFKLTTDMAGEQVVKLIATDTTNDEDETDLHNAYRVAKPGESGVNTFITDDDGDITISGLEAGTYYLYEVAAPSGYNQLKDPITIVITMTDPETGDATITVDGEDVTSDDGTVVDVQNKKGIELPETGSIGTVGLTAAGVAIVLAGVLAPRKKKSEQE